MNNSDDKTKAYRSFALGLSFVSEVLVFTLAGYFIGKWLDKKLVTKNEWISVVFSLIGLTLGFIKLYKSLVKSNKNE